MKRYLWEAKDYLIREGPVYVCTCCLQRLQQIMGKRPFGGLQVIALGNFLSNGTCDIRFKDDDEHYGPLSIDLWADNFYIYSLP